jgi:hypothetical protein
VNNLLLIITAVTLFVGCYAAYRRSHDPLHPGVFLFPMLFAGYGVWPLVLNLNGDIDRLLGPQRFTEVTVLYLLSLAAFYLGLLQHPSAGDLRRMEALPGRARPFALQIEDKQRRRAHQAAVALALLAVSAQWYMLSNVGGFVQAYSRHKGGGYASSGYVGEALLFAYPAILLLAVARSGKPIRARDIALALITASPHLSQGVLGGRRGPLFLILATLYLAWHIARGIRPTFRGAAIAVSAMVLAVVLVWSQRQFVFMGSESSVDLRRIATVVDVESLTESDYIAGAATVLAADYHSDFYWGYRYLVTLLVRPIPRQLWPTKYADVGATWVDAADAEEGMYDILPAVGFMIPAGASIGFLADLYHEFWWFCLVAAYCFGRVYSWGWYKHRIRGELWTVLFAEMVILGIYVPTQSFSAWFHRYLFMAVFTALFWRLFVGKAGRSLPQGAALRA